MGKVIWSIMGLGEAVLGLGEELWGGHLVHNGTGRGGVGRSSDP